MFYSPHLLCTDKLGYAPFPPYTTGEEGHTSSAKGDTQLLLVPAPPCKLRFSN